METQSRKAHPLLRKALEALYETHGPAGRPPPPYHLGPPTPQLAARDQAKLALWIYEDAIRRDPLHEAFCAPVYRQLKENLSQPSVPGFPSTDRRLRELELSPPEPPTDPITVLIRAVEVANDLSRHDQSAVGNRAEAVIKELTIALATRDLATAQAFTLRLDDEIIRLECEHVVRLLQHGPPPPVRILWRWAPETGSRAEQWIARTKAGHAWIAAAPRSVPGKGKRAFFEGTLDDALSCVPDGLFAAAADVALRRDASM